MTEEEKQLLLKDLCGRLLYGIIASVRGSDEEFQHFHILGVKDGKVWVRNDILHVDNFDDVEVIKPYLRSMSSMTKDEYKEYDEFEFISASHFAHGIEAGELTDWLNAHHFDYRGLIEKGLAIEAPEDMYK